ncbi:MAG: PAS domain-containing protein [Chloroflexi bacterium]|nr:PAS domain-containing protein [Chloroflexota bacterium]
MLQFTPYALVTFGAGIIALFLAYVIWRKRPGVGVAAFSILALAIALWSLANAARLTVVPFSTKVILNALMFVGIVTVPSAWLVFILQYTGRDQWVTRRNVGYLFIMPVLTIIAIISNPLHGLWGEPLLMTEGGLNTLSYTLGPAFWVHAVYSYILLLIAAIFLIETLIRSRDLYRGQALLLLIGTFTPWFANAIFIFQLSPLPPYVDLTALAFTVSTLAYGWSMYRYRLIDIVPVAKDIVIDTLTDAVIVLDRNARIVEANPATLKLIGRPAGEVLGQPVTEIISGESELIERYRASDHARDEITLDLQGESFTFDLIITPLRNRQGELTGRVLLLHDITALKKANADLVVARQVAEDANRVKSEFLATMSHELRTPLNAIIGFTEIMLAGMGGAELSDKTRHMTERVHANSRDLLQMINDVLDLAKIEARRVEIVNKPFSPAELLHNIHSELAGIAQKQQLTFVLDLADDLPNELVGDQFQVRRVVTNLVSNALKFTEDGQVSLTSSKDDLTWIITVRDTGIGIPPHALEYIFDPFRQVDGSSKRAFGGTGLGLAITKELVAAMGGSIEVTSTLQEGSTFVVKLPYKPVPESQNLEGVTA